MTHTSRARALAALSMIAAAAPALAAPSDDRLTPSPTASVEVSAPRGVFDVVIERDGQAPMPAKILVEQRANRVEATLIVDERVSSMRVVRSDAQSINASVPTSFGNGELSLRVDGDAIGGTLKAKKRAWKVSGVRTI